MAPFWVSLVMTQTSPVALTGRLAVVYLLVSGPLVLTGIDKAAEVEHLDLRLAAPPRPGLCTGWPPLSCAALWGSAQPAALFTFG
jgi:hypothetical protein